jgi:CubicO group peptidase (beta-lactamase class C family)
MPLPSIRCVVPALALVVLALPAAAQRADRAATVAAIDSIARAAVAGGRTAGLSVAVVRGRDTLLLMGYGQADAQRQVPTPERAIYQIGSVTKQFTAAAILQLAEQGKLSLDDDLTRHLPTYDTQGRRITVRRLLDHTSGIKGYTEMASFGAIAPLTLPRDTLVTLFSRAPFEFEPGERQIYNNSAYFLLGLIVEKASGMPYAEYVKRNLFDRAGMADSHYCGSVPATPRHATGHQYGASGLGPARTISQTWPYAAGSLCSTAGDLVAWNQALHGGRILSPASYREMLVPGTLNDGTRLRYAKGLILSDVAGHRAIHPGGGIPGFLSSGVYVPGDSLLVIVLANTAGPVDPGDVSEAIVARVLGRPAPRAEPYPGDLAALVGSYQGVGRGRPLELRIVPAEGGLAVQRGTTRDAPLRYVGGDTWETDEGHRYTFVMEGGRVVRVRADLTSVYSILTRA